MGRQIALPTIDLAGIRSRHKLQLHPIDNFLNTGLSSKLLCVE